MSRTKGSGWGGGTLLYQICPFCGKKKAIFDTVEYLRDFKCISCRERFDSTTLIRKKYK